MKNTLLTIVLTVISFAFPLISGCNGEERSRGVSGMGGSSRLSELLRAGDVEGYALALEPRSFFFPQDHGQHPAYRNEWWYVTGNLDGAGGERFGFELTIFRFALTPTAEGTSPATSSAWATNQVFIGHFAVTDVLAGQFHVAERYSRGALGLAGAEALTLNVWLEDWYLRAAAGDEAGGAWRLHAKDRDVEVSLSLTPLKARVITTRSRECKPMAHWR
jgi:predicted secreted hydrolase